jgi:hypothetical protein
LPAKAIVGSPSPASLAPTGKPHDPLPGGFFYARIPGTKKPAITLAWGFRDESGRVCGHFGVMGNQRDKRVLLAMGQLAEALQQFAFVQ